jgi:hypothetical protein
MTYGSPELVRVFRAFPFLAPCPQQVGESDALTTRNPKDTENRLVAPIEPEA